MFSQSFSLVERRNNRRPFKAVPEPLRIGEETKTNPSFPTCSCSSSSNLRGRKWGGGFDLSGLVGFVSDGDGGGGGGGGGTPSWKGEGFAKHLFGSYCILVKNQTKIMVFKIHIMFCVVFDEIRILFAILLPLLLPLCEKLCWEKEEGEEEDDDKQTGIEAISPERKWNAFEWGLGSHL